MPETTVKVTKDTVTISELKEYWGREGQTIQFKAGGPKELQLFVDRMPASVKGKTMSMKCNLTNFQNILVNY